MQNRLPQEETHPSFHHLSKPPEATARPPLPAYSQTDPNLPTLMVSDDEESDSNEPSDPGLLMCQPLSLVFLMLSADSAKGEAL